MNYLEDYRQFLKTHGWKDWFDKGHETGERTGAPRPPVEKPYPEDAVLIDLVPPEDFTVGDMSVREVIGRRRSRRRYSDDALTLEELSYLLWATQGVTGVFDLKNGTATARTVPSGGSQHTFETYLCINRVEGIDPGLYRYLPLAHKLLFIRTEEDLAARIAKSCAGQRFVKTSAVIFMWTTTPCRMEWRYTIVAHKVIAMDAGHLCQNLYLAAESIGAGTCAVGAYFQEEMDAILGVDGEEEFTVYVAPVGKLRE